MSEVNQEGTSLSEHSAADLLAGLIDETGGIRQPENEGEQQEENDEAEEQSEEQGEQEAEDGQSEQSEQPQMVKVKVNGVEMEVPLSEVVAGYQKDADYRQKTADLAEQRRATESERQAVSQERSQLSERLSQADALLNAQIQQFQNLDWNTLLEQDPQGYLRARHEYDSVLAGLQQVRNERSALDQQIQAEQAQFAEQHLASEREKLAKAFPQWADASVAKAEQTAIRQYLEAQGYSKAEIQGASDHRALVLAHKALKFDELMAKSQQAVTKVKQTPLKVEKPGGHAEPENKRARDAALNARKTGRADDAANALLAMGLVR